MPNILDHLDTKYLDSAKRYEKHAFAVSRIKYSVVTFCKELNLREFVPERVTTGTRRPREVYLSADQLKTAAAQQIIIEIRKQNP